jgi:hypothetical protein
MSSLVCTEPLADRPPKSSARSEHHRFAGADTGIAGLGMAIGVSAERVIVILGTLTSFAAFIAWPAGLDRLQGRPTWPTNAVISVTSEFADWKTLDGSRSVMRVTAAPHFRG